MKSIYQKLNGNIAFPEFQGRILYMHKTKLNDLVLPAEFKDYQDTLHEIVDSIADNNVIGYITIDEKVVLPATTHRRPGIHVDFNWYENVVSHNKHRPMGSHISSPPGHKAPLPTWQYPGHSSPSPRWNEPVITPGHSISPGTHNWADNGAYIDGVGGGMLLTSNYSACQVYRGEFDGVIGDGGDCQTIDVSNLETEIMEANKVYFINALGIHEGLPVTEKIKRSLVRINFHPDYQFKLVA